jgi:hypothetical protein
MAATMRETVGLDELDIVAVVDAHDAREPGRCSDPIDGSFQVAHST